MHDTLATIMTSRRSNSELVAEWRSLSISSLMLESFSIYVSVGRNIGFRLIIVVVADEILYRIIREKFLKLAAQLRCQRLVVRNDERSADSTRSLIMCNRIGFARSRCT